MKDNRIAIKQLNPQEPKAESKPARRRHRHCRCVWFKDCVTIRTPIDSARAPTLAPNSLPRPHTAPELRPNLSRLCQVQGRALANSRVPTHPAPRLGNTSRLAQRFAVHHTTSGELGHSLVNALTHHKSAQEQCDWLGTQRPSQDRSHDVPITTFRLSVERPARRSIQNISPSLSPCPRPIRLRPFPSSRNAPRWPKLRRTYRGSRSFAIFAQRSRSLVPAPSSLVWVHTHA